MMMMESNESNSNVINDSHTKRLENEILKLREMLSDSETKLGRKTQQLLTQAESNYNLKLENDKLRTKAANAEKTLQDARTSLIKTISIIHLN